MWFRTSFLRGAMDPPQAASPTTHRVQLAPAMSKVIVPDAAREPRTAIPDAFEAPWEAIVAPGDAGIGGAGGAASGAAAPASPPEPLLRLCAARREYVAFQVRIDTDREYVLAVDKDANWLSPLARLARCRVSVEVASGGGGGAAAAAAEAARQHVKPELFVATYIDDGKGGEIMEAGTVALWNQSPDTVIVLAPSSVAASWKQ